MSLTPNTIRQLTEQESPELECGIDGLLRQLKEEDISQFYIDCMNLPKIRKFLVQPNLTPQTKISLTEYARINFEAPDAILFGLFIKGVHRGNVRLHNISLEFAFLGIAIFDSQLWGKGWGSRTIKTVSDFAIHKLKINKILAGISNENSASIRAFKKAGYQKQRSNNPQELTTRTRFWEYSVEQ